MIEVKVPELAESITEGTIAEWTKSVGESIEKGETIAELETDKVNVEIKSEHTGVIKEFLFEPGENVEVGQVIAVLGDAGETGGSAPAEEAAAATPVAVAPQEEKAEEPKQEVPAAKAPEVEKKSLATRTAVASPAARKKARELEST
jgi:2-oxoglutarate dehydrogenase E2 component (dihydrolipoamide succinyltransferase)